MTPKIIFGLKQTHMSSDEDKKDQEKRMWIGIGVGVGGLLLVFILWWVWRRNSSNAQGLSHDSINAEMTKRILKNPNFSAETRRLLD